MALVLLALVAELLGRSLSHRLDFGRHVGTPSYSGTDYYPFLRLGVPAVFLVPGPGAYQGLTTDSSQALRRPSRSSAEYQYMRSAGALIASARQRS